MLLTVSDKLVFKTYVKGGISVGCECHSCLAREILGLSVLVTDGIADL